jgi:uncharacterized protein YneF (UPF0154 family)
MKRNKALELLIGTLGFIIGGMLGLWLLIEIVQRAIQNTNG